MLAEKSFGVKVGLVGRLHYGYQNPVFNVDPDGQFGVPGLVMGAMVNLVVQFGANLYVSHDFGRSIRCVDWLDVAISGAMGFVSPSLIGNVIRGAPGPLELTVAQMRYIYFTKSLPVGFALKKGFNYDLSKKDGCGRSNGECEGLGLGTAIGSVTQW